MKGRPVKAATRPARYWHHMPVDTSMKGRQLKNGDYSDVVFLDNLIKS
jgi:hypothetical protein